MSHFAPPTPTLAPVALALLISGCAGGGTAPSEPGPAPAPTPAPPAGEWALVFADEFDTPGPPDPAKWTYDIGYIANNEAQYYTSRPENARVEDGNLVIEARKEPWMGYDYTSARLKTEGLAEFLNVAIGGSWGGLEGIDDTLLPHFMYVDFVRVYQRQ